MATYPSIFNDVIGPLMRGPSSSHCAGAIRIGRLCRDLMDGAPGGVNIFVDPEGSLATTYESQGSDLGMKAGLLGWEATDERLSEAGVHLERQGIQVSFEVSPIEAKHPNAYRLMLEGPGGTCSITALSTGGGMIEITEIDGTGISLAGDYHETLVYCHHPDRVLQACKDSLTYDDVLVLRGQETIVQVRSQARPDQGAISLLRNRQDVRMVRQARPVLPVLSGRGIEIPFLSTGEMLRYNRKKGLSLWELALTYESQRGRMSESQVQEMMNDLAGYMENAVAEGLQGTEYSDRILPSQSPAYRSKLDKGRLLGGDLTNRIILYATAVMEVKSAMGLIVAAPTAGSCGTLPGALLGVADSMGLSRDDVVKALLAAGMIGIFISRHATFAAESGGCQAECGAASGMAAAGLVTLAGGTLRQALAASSLALQNSMGMICDPIANRVEAPCLGKNIMAAVNALSCANMALAGFNPLIPLDEVILAMNEVGASLPRSLRCTALGGLSVTPAAKKIEDELKDKYHKNKTP
jgi:L-serine dehydratase